MALLMKQTVTTTKEIKHKPLRLREIALTQILVPTDFSAKSQVAVNYAAALARHLGTQLTLLHVVPEPSPFDYSIGGVPGGQWEQVREKAEKELDDEIARVKASYDRVDSLVRTGADLHEQIVSAAREVSADLVVLSTHGYTGWMRLFFGSDAEQLSREIPCPVLVIRRK
jgi:nucleotide-binding universal stress UspA family protein